MSISFSRFVHLFKRQTPQVCRLCCQLPAAVLLVLFPQVTFAATQYAVDIEPVPAWVKTVEMATPDSIPVDDIDSGNYYLLLDNQVKVDEDNPQVRFTRLQQLVVNQRGLEHNSQIEVDFDPLYESLTFHSISIIRDTQIIDKLTDSEISLLKQEGRIEQGLYDGRLTANIILADLRIGDVIDYSYSITGANPIYQGIFAYRRGLQWSVPLHAQHVRVLWGKNQPLYVNMRNSQDSVTESKLTIDNSTYVEYAISRSDSPILQNESNTPTWYNPYVTVYFSEINSWNKVVDWALPMYSKAGMTGTNIKGAGVEGSGFKGVNVQQVIEDIKRKTPVPNQRVMYALNYVQDQIRYLGLEMGVNSHQPSRAEDTLSRRYGDCKDKVVLFITLLKGMDIDAYPVLVDTDEGLDLPSQPASINAFNHVVAKVQVLGMIYWLDPTMNYQKGPLQGIYQANYHYGLVIKPGVSELAQIKIHNPKSMLTVVESYDLSAGKDGKSTLSVKSQYQGDRAQNFRYQLEDIGFKALQTLYEDYYRDIFADIALTDKVTINDDKQTGVLYSQQDYRINHAWQPDGEDFSVAFASYQIKNALNKPNKADRNSPYSTGFPNKIQHTIHVQVSDGDWEFPSETITENNPFFSYEFSSNFDDTAKTLTLTFNYRSKVESITAMDLGDYIDAIEKIEDSLYYSVLTYGEGSRATTEQTSVSDPVTSDGLDNKSQLIILCALLYILGLIYAIATWRIDSSSRINYSDERYYPVSRRKLLFLSLATGGIYTSYWFYRNWKYVKESEQLGIMPIARGIFSAFWYYPLFTHLVEDSKERYAKNTVMPMGMGIAAAILFFIANYTYNSDHLYLAGMMAVPILLFPLLNYINHLNGSTSLAYVDNSAWKVRHTLVSILFIPWILLAIGTDLTVFPSGKIMTGEQVSQRNIDFMSANKIIEENEDVLMFYSDGFISYQEDGNGFTQSSVFSYWKEGGELNIATADFVDVKNLKVEYGDALDSQTVITVQLNDDSDFVLIVSTEDKLDLTFYQSLRRNWYQSNKRAKNEDS